MKILLVEDNKILGEGLKLGLIQVGFEVEWCQSVFEYQELGSIEPYAAILLDIGLPDGTGLNILQNLRKNKSTTPVLILTARDSLQDKVTGLNLGADDYLVKPFALEELVARLKALIRRSHHIEENILKYGNLSLDPLAKSVWCDSEKIEISHREFNLLEYLLLNQGRVYSRGQLETVLYGYNADVESNAIEVHIHHLRKKFGNHLIKTVRGVGYTIEKIG